MFLVLSSHLQDFLVSVREKVRVRVRVRVRGKGARVRG